LANVPSGNQTFVATHIDFVDYNNGGTQLNVSGNLNKSFQMTVKSLTYTAGWSATTSAKQIAVDANNVHASSIATEINLLANLTGAKTAYTTNILGNQMGVGLDDTGNVYLAYGGQTIACHRPLGTVLGSSTTVNGDVIDIDGAGLNNQAILLHDRLGSGLELSIINTACNAVQLFVENGTNRAPKSLAVYPAGNKIFVACGNNNGVRIYTTSGSYQASYLNRSIAAVGCKGNRLAINDPINQQVLVYYVGNGSFIQMSAINTGFTGRGGVDMDTNYRVYVTDDILNTIRQYLP
jgi:hypothetical protein